MFIIGYVIIGIVVVALCLIEGLDRDWDSIKNYCRNDRFWFDTIISVMIWPVALVALVTYIFVRYESEKIES